MMRDPDWQSEFCQLIAEDGSAIEQSATICFDVYRNNGETEDVVWLILETDGIRVRAPIDCDGACKLSEVSREVTQLLGGHVSD